VRGLTILSKASDRGLINTELVTAVAAIAAVVRATGGGGRYVKAISCGFSEVQLVMQSPLALRL
jgi:glutamate formiminotransferase